MPHAAKILIVDDSESTRMALKEVLLSAGYKVTEAENGKVALLMAQESQFDLVITDIKMPVMGGIEFIKELRHSNKYQSTPVMTLAGPISPQEVGELKSVNIMFNSSGIDTSIIPVDSTMKSIH